MKIVKLFIGIVIAVSGLMIQSCSSANEELLSTSQDGYVLLSRSSAQSQIDDLVANNTYLDYDFASIAPGATSRRGNMVTEDEVITRVIWYRFFKLEAVENERIVVKGTAEDINISQRAFDHCMRCVEGTNQFLIGLLSEGYSLKEALSRCHNVTPESIENVIRLQ